VSELAELVRSGQYNWDELDLDDINVRLKWLGLFHRGQKTPGRFMFRLRVPNGGLSSTQLRTMGNFLIDRYGELANGGHGCADITSRANIQLRGIPLSDADNAVSMVNSIGLTSKMSGMDNVRNLTGSPIAGLDGNEILDTRPYTEAIQDSIAGHPEYANLPRKFNIAVDSGSGDDFAHLHINDIGLEPARNANGNVRLMPHIGGYMSTKRCAHSFKPADFDWSIPADPSTAAEFCTAVLRVFRENGYRGNRQKCRLIWMVEETGLEQFKHEVASEMGISGFEPAVPKDASRVEDQQPRDLLGIHKQTKGPDGYYWACMTVPVGRLQPSDLNSIADLTDRYSNGEVRMTAQGNILLPNIPESMIESFMTEPLLQRLPLDAGPIMGTAVACTGTHPFMTRSNTPDST
jgi:ferredoxin-nitrite reductase